MIIGPQKWLYRFKDLTAYGNKFAPDVEWRILVGRYNYSTYLPNTGPEISGYPTLTKTNFHLLEEYARLELIK